MLLIDGTILGYISSKMGVGVKKKTDMGRGHGCFPRLPCRFSKRWG